MTLEILIPFFFASLVLMIKPGPYMMALISLALEGKWRSMLGFWVGYASISLGLYYILLSSLSLLPEGYGILFIFFKGFAAILFITLGLKSFGQTIDDFEEGAEHIKEKADRKTLLNSFAAGGLLCISSPYELIWIVAVIPAIIGQFDFTLWEITIIFGVAISANIIVQLSYCLPLLFVRRFLSHQTLRFIKKLSAFSLIGVGVYIFSTILLQWDLIAAGTISEKI